MCIEREQKRIWRVFEGTDGHKEVSKGESVPQKGSTLSLRELCDRRENRGSAPIREAFDSVRGLTIGSSIHQE